MDSMDNFRERIEALEQRTEQLQQHTRMVERRLCWWRGIACGVMLLGLVSMPLQSGTAADTQPRGMAERMATLENKLSAMAFDDAANEVVITGANLRIVNGLGSTDCTDAQGNPIPNCPNGLGNLIVGYNEERPFPGSINTRTGSHNVVVGRWNNFSSFGGLVVGEGNEISGFFASVSGGGGNTASGTSSSVSGGFSNTAREGHSWVGGGVSNTASGGFASVSGGQINMASGERASVSGGFNNTASGANSSVSGGENNTASGQFSSVSGGTNHSAPGTENWAAGPLFATN